MAETGVNPEFQELPVGEELAEGKTKRIALVPSRPGHVLLIAKDAITAHNGTRQGQMEGKGVIATSTCASVFRYLQAVGIRTSFVAHVADDRLLCRACQMVPIEWVARRMATGSFLKRHTGVPEGYRFSPVKLELFYKDDAAGDPEWSEEQLISANLSITTSNMLHVAIGRKQVQLMKSTTGAVFEALERLWTSLGVQLVDMKIEFGVDKETGQILVADVIDNDSWRLWPAGDKRLQKDKQLFRDVEDVTPEFMRDLKKNYQWVADALTGFNVKTDNQVVILMGSAKDADHCRKIRDHLSHFGINVDLRVTSAHKGTSETLRIVAEYEARGTPVVFIACAGRSNGLGPVLAGNTALPVINCPPAGTCESDVFSSLHVPSGLGCTTVLYPEAAALAAAAILGLQDPTLQSRLAVQQLTNRLTLMTADDEINTLEEQHKEEDTL